MKKIYVSFICVFLIICCIPVFTMPFFSENSSAEKRELSEFPVIFSEETGFNKNFTSEINTYLSEHFSFRSYLVTAWSVLQAKLFKTSTQKKVIVGKDDWLFFSDTLPDFCGDNIFSDRETKKVVKTLSLINECVQAAGSKFIFVVAPNKNTVYPQYMPYYIKRSNEKSNYDKLNELLKNEEYYINVLPLFKSRSEQLYHKRDSHWNNLGAALCFSEIAKCLSLRYTDYSSLSYHIEKTWNGDLDDMIFPTLGYMDDQVVFDKMPEFAYTSSFHSQEDLKIKTASVNGQGNLIIIRDSFTNALQPFFSEIFKKAYFTRILPCRLNDIKIKRYDTVILELAERNLPELLKSAPVIEAPERTPKNVTEITGEVFSEEELGYLHVYGTLENYCDTVYLSAERDGNTVFFEAFPIYERELLNSKKAKNAENGFSAYVPIEFSENLRFKIFTVEDK